MCSAGTDDASSTAWPRGPRRHPRLAQPSRGALECLGDALRLELSAVERLVLCALLCEHDALHERIQGLDRDIDAGLEPWRERIALLQTIPGIDRPSACAILAEIGPDLDAFGNAERLAAWAGGVRATARAPASAARPALARAARRGARCSSSARMARRVPMAASSAATTRR